MVNVRNNGKTKGEQSYIREALYSKKNWIQKIENPTMKDIKKAVSENGMAIRFIENPSDEIIKTAIEQNPMCIQHINEISDENIKKALELNVSSIQFIKNPSQDIIAYAKKLNPKRMKKYRKNSKGYFEKIRPLIENIDDINMLANDEIIALLKKDGNLIKYIDKPSNEMLFAAVGKSPNAIRWINSPSEAVMKKAFENDPISMKKYVINDDGVVEKKVNSKKKDIFQQVISAMSELEQEKLVQKDAGLIRYMDIVPYKLQLAVVKQNYMNLRYIRQIDDKIFEYLYDAKDFNIYIFRDHFDIQMKIVDYFEKIEKNRKSNIEDGKKVKEESKADYSKELLRVWEEMNNQVEEKEYSTNLISSEIPINLYINYFTKKIECVIANIACGFLYKSGLELIEPLIQEIKKNEYGRMKIVVGSLQTYYHASTDNKLVNINLETARALNDLISNSKIDLYTLENKFYHGKYFFFEGKKMSVCIVGSSNLTYSGFSGNYELNTIFLLKNETKQYTMLKGWFDNFLLGCTKIDVLLECNFTNTNMIFDTINAGANIESIDVNLISKEVQSLADEEVKFRLNLWLNEKPTNIYRNLDIENLKDYVAFEFKKQELFVFESFESANAYYYLYGNNIYDIVQKVKELTKTQIFEIAGMKKRGYHIKDRNALKKKISSLFI